MEAANIFKKFKEWGEVLEAGEKRRREWGG